MLRSILFLVLFSVSPDNKRRWLRGNYGSISILYIFCTSTLPLYSIYTVCTMYSIYVYYNYIIYGGDSCSDKHAIVLSSVFN